MLHQTTNLFLGKNSEKKNEKVCFPQHVCKLFVTCRVWPRENDGTQNFVEEVKFLLLGKAERLEHIEIVQWD